MVTTFDEYKKMIVGEGRHEKTEADWNDMAAEIEKAKELSDGEKKRLLDAIGFAITESVESNAKAELKQAKKDAEPEIIHDEIRTQTRGRRKVVAVAKESDGVKYLGHLVGFSIGACAVPNKVVTDFWEGSGLPAWARPKAAHPSDAFARSCQMLQNEHEVRKLDKGQISCDLQVKGLTQTEYMITRRIIIEDERGKRDLGWANIARAHLEGEGEDIKKYKVVVKPEGKAKGLDKVAQAVQQRIRTQYQVYMDNIVDKQIRDALRNTIYNLGGVGFSMGRGGAWFVPLDGTEIVQGWRGFTSMVDAKYKSGTFPVSIRCIPLADEVEYRQMVAEDVASEVQERMETLLTETLAALEKSVAYGKKKGIDDDKQAEALDKILTTRLQAHAQTIELLEDYKDVLRTKIHINLKSLTERLEKVEVKLSERHQVALRKLALLEQPPSVRAEKSAKKVAAKAEVKGEQ